MSFQFLGIFYKSSPITAPPPFPLQYNIVHRTIREPQPFKRGNFPLKSSAI